jgi:two-component system sensor histidine kinase PhoQ
VSRSIERRLLLSNLLILIAFLGLAAVALDRAYRSSLETAAGQQLQAHLYTLLAAAQESESGRMRLPTLLATPGFNQPDSGLYALVSGEQGDYRWRSASLLGRPDLPIADMPPGSRRFRLTATLALLEQGITWEDNAGVPRHYSLSIALDRAPLDGQQRSFRTSLWQWLGGVALLLLIAQLLLVRWGLRPLHAMSAAVQRLESGASGRIEGPVASELQGLADNLNSLIQVSHQRQERVRNGLADLAHSLKTPLAVLRGAADEAGSPGLARLIGEQTQRIDQIVSYQRQRAAVAGGSGITRPIALRPILERLCTSLQKVHRARAIACRLQLPGDDRLRADEGDLFELFGNLLENAFRHCRGQVRVTLQREAGADLIEVEDDGEGIAEDDARRLLQRGERADQQHPGEGIGLAVVNEITRQYGGRLSIRRSTLGGACIQIHLAR